MLDRTIVHSSTATGIVLIAIVAFPVLKTFLGEHVHRLTFFLQWEVNILI